MYPMLLAKEESTKDPSELKEELDNLEFSMLRMQDNVQKIAKKSRVLGVDQTKDDKLVVVYTPEEPGTCKIMLNDSDSAYQGKWDFSIQATYADEETIHIGDIKGPADKGYGSVCMKYLKSLAADQNIPFITGDIAERDYGHVDRLIHFYEKHGFDVTVNHAQKTGDIMWSADLNR
ncbi:hypothetical protein [Alteribacillus sp. HJP-4]|uniref:hypothetical protein n=1 Tax=Alteribacillus sp. HJP-4 TaxID=2775394 RepID=UPI0035CCDFA0